MAMQVASGCETARRLRAAGHERQEFRAEDVSASPRLVMSDECTCRQCTADEPSTGSR